MDCIDKSHKQHTLYNVFYSLVQVFVHPDVRRNTTFSGLCCTLIVNGVKILLRSRPWAADKRMFRLYMKV